MTEDHEADQALREAIRQRARHQPSRTIAGALIAAAIDRIML